MEKMNLEGKVHTFDLVELPLTTEPPSLNGIIIDEQFPPWKGISGYDER